MPGTTTTTGKAKAINIFDKTISKKFPTWQAFWGQAKTALLNAGIAKTEKDKINAYYFTWKVYDFWKYNIYWGYADQFYNKLYTKIALAFLELQKRETLYNNLFKTLKLNGDKVIKLKDEETTTPGQEHTRDKKTGMVVDRKWDNTAKDQAQVKSINRNKPNSAVDLIAGEYGIENRADWLQTEMETAYGIRTKKGDKISFAPNWSEGKGHWHDKTNTTNDLIRKASATKKITKREEQPNFTQQIANIVRSFTLAESSITEYVVDYFTELFYNNTIFMPPGADLNWDQTRQSFKYQVRGEIEEETEEPGKPKKPKQDTDRITYEEWSRLRDDGEAVEDTLDLENLCRQRQHCINNPMKDATKQNTMLKALNGLVWAFTRRAFWPTLAQYDKVMGAITGFKEFKSELRTNTELAEYYLDIGQTPPQTFYCLLGKPGVGKSEISKTLAKAYKRPFNVLGMAGTAHPKILKGMRQTLDGAKYGQITASFVDAKANIFITKAEHRAELDRLKAKPKKTKNQEEYIKWLETEIKAIEEQEKNETKWKAELATIRGKGEVVTKGDIITIIDDLKDIETEILKANLQKKINDIHGKYYDLQSKAPVILMDEAEKVKEETVLFIMGQICDRELNYWYVDDFLDYGVNLNEAVILLTANYAEKVPDFVRSRCKFVNIQLLTYRERLNILQIRRDMMIRDYFPAPRFKWENPSQKERALDAYNKGRSRIAPLTIDRTTGAVTSDYNDSTIYLTDDQQRIKELISDEMLELSITETFGIREGIMNIVSIISFLLKARVRKVIGDGSDPTNQLPQTLFIAGTGHDMHGNEREDIDDPDAKKEGNGLINLYFNCVRDGNGDMEPLTIMKKRDVEYKKEQTAEKGKAECVLNLVPNWNGYNKYDPNWKPKAEPPTE